MKPRRPWRNGPAFNPFRILPPAQHIIAKAAKAGVDTTSRPAIEEWRRTGKVNNTGEVE